MAGEEKINAEKKNLKELEQKLKFQGKLAWDRMSEEERQETLLFAEGYKKFLDQAKTEREAVEEIKRIAQQAGFLDGYGKLKGNKLFFINKEKTIALAVIKRGFTHNCFSYRFAAPGLEAKSPL